MAYGPDKYHIDVLVQERRNSIASYVFLALTHRYND